MVTRDFLDARLVKDLTSALELTAGVNNMASPAGGAKASPGMFAGQGQFAANFLLRGQQADVRSDGFKVDEIVNTNADLAAYERIEVVKGPSSFYGQGSLGGFINMVRKKPQAEFSANVSVEAGSFNSYRSEIDVTGALNKDKTMNGHISMAYEGADAFTDDIENKRVMIAPSLEVILSDNTRILTQALYQKDTFDSNPGIPLELIDDQINAYSNFSSQTELYSATCDEKSTTDTIDLMVKVDHELSERWLASLLLQGNKASRDIIEGNAASVYYGNLYAKGMEDTWEGDSWASELRLVGSFDAFGQEHQVILGAELNAQERTRDWGAEYINLGDPNLFSGNLADYGIFTREDIPTAIDRNLKEDAKALYAQAIFTLQEKTKLLIGARYDSVYQHVVWTSPWEEHDSDADKNAFTKRLGLTHELTSNISTYASYSESFSPTTSVGKEGVLEPIKGKGYELGAKTDWFSSQLGATLAVYRQDLTNRPMSDPTDPTGLYSISTGLHRTEGVELEVVGSPYPGLTITAVASWMDNEFLDDDNYEGLAIDGSVDSQYGLFANYEWQTGVVKGLAIGASFIKLDERQFTHYQNDNYSQTYLEGYERLDINLSYNEIPNVDISLLIRNVTDNTYIETSANLPQGNYYGAPRSVLLKATYHFD